MNQTIKKTIKWTVIVILILGVIGVGYGQYKKSGQDTSKYTTAVVERGDLEQTVSATGTVKPLSEVELNFKTPGEIVSVNVSKGHRVEENDVLANQDDSSTQIAVRQAQANLTSAIATLNQLKAGATSEEIEVSEKNVESAQTAYDNAVKRLESVRKKTTEDIKTYEEGVKATETAITDKTTTLNDVDKKYAQNIDNLEESAVTTMSGDVFAIEAALDLVNKSLTNNGEFNSQQTLIYLSQLNKSYLTSAQTSYGEGLSLSDQMKIAVAKLEDGTDTDVVASLNLSINTLNKTKQALSLVYTSLQNTVSTISYTQSEIDANESALVAKQIVVDAAISELQSAQQNLIDASITYDNQLNTAQANVNTAQDNLATAKANLRAAEADRDLQISNVEAEIDTTLAALNLAQSQLTQKKAPPRWVDLASQEAQVQQYRAALALAQENLENNTLRSPIAGIVTEINYEVGEQTTSAEPVVVLVSNGNYEIEVDISEADIVKIENSDQVKVTLDALGEEVVFNARVIFIDPAQTVVSEVVYYKVKIALEQNGNDYFSKIKPGMTANLDIMTDARQNVLFMPQRAFRNGSKYVRVLERRGQEQSVKEVEVETGLIGDGGFVEVLSGLTEGQEVVTFVKNGK